MNKQDLEALIVYIDQTLESIDKKPQARSTSDIIDRGFENEDVYRNLANKLKNKCKSWIYEMEKNNE